MKTNIVVDFDNGEEIAAKLDERNKTTEYTKKYNKINYLFTEITNLIQSNKIPFRFDTRNVEFDFNDLSDEFRDPHISISAMNDDYLSYDAIVSYDSDSGKYKMLVESDKMYFGYVNTAMEVCTNISNVEDALFLSGSI